MSSRDKEATPREISERNFDEKIVNLERVILSSILLNNEKMDEVSDVLKEHDFYLPVHKRAFACLAELKRQNLPLDENMIINKFALANRPSEEELVEIFSASPIANIKAYIDEVKAASIKRTIRTISAHMIDDSYKEEEGIGDILSRIESEIYALSRDAVSSEFKNSRELAYILVDELEALKKRGNIEITGIPTGFYSLDLKTSGLRGGELVVIGARPAMGKTAFVGNISLNMAKAGYGIAFFELEMRELGVMMRMLSLYSLIPFERVKKANLDDSEWAKVAKFSEFFMGLDFYLDVDTNLTISKLKSKIRQLKSLRKVDVVIIDYLQLMQGEGRNEERYKVVSEISRGLKLLALELDLPVIALSQLSRALESRDDKRPNMSDLRESGAIEQDADQIYFLYRDSVYAEREERIREKKAREDGKEYTPKFVRKPVDDVEVIIAKNRNGEIGTIELQFDGAHMHFFEKGKVIKDEDYTPTDFIDADFVMPNIDEL